MTLPLLRRESMGDAYHVLTFDDPEGTVAVPGQFAMVRGAEWGEAPLLARPMSYLNAGKTPSILLKVFGEGTLRMGRAEPGEPFSLLGPLGNGWHTPSPSRRPVLVGGGVGIAPLIFFARELHANGVRPNVVYGGRTAKDLPLDDELAEVADVHIATEDGSLGRAGLVTELLESVLDANAEVYACGPDRMLARVAEICAARDLPCEASLETPMACGYGVCLGCAVPTPEGQYLYACVEGPCVDTRRIDWTRGDYAPRRAGRRRPA
ncbi:MAG TPA: dihydroorotate dehydrogenase electron transfer subunit [Polyangiales bacterium]|nr:dihydroorotate dehydrogenase electron transfer subunit [Polyangiales bacterium]